MEKNNKISIIPKDSKTLITDIFECDGEINLIRIIYENDGLNYFNFFKFGNNKFDYSEVGTAYYNPTSAIFDKVKDIPLNVKFNKGDDFIFQSVSNIERIELFIK